MTHQKKRVKKRKLNIKFFCPNITFVIIGLLLNFSVTYGELYYNPPVSNQDCLNNAIYNAQNQKYGGVILNNSDTPSEIKDRVIPIYIPPIISNTNKVFISDGWTAIHYIRETDVEFNFWDFMANESDGGISTDQNRLAKTLSLGAVLLDRAMDAFNFTHYMLIILKYENQNDPTIPYPYMAVIQTSFYHDFFANAAQLYLYVSSSDNFFCLHDGCADFKRNVGIPVDDYDFEAFFFADEEHKSDLYGAYFGIVDTNHIIYVPKIYPKDRLVIGPHAKYNFFPWTWGKDWSPYKVSLSGVALSQGTIVGSASFKFGVDTITSVEPGNFPESVQYEERSVALFNDVRDDKLNHWYSKFVYQLYSARVIEYTEEFNPSALITRGQFIAWAIRAKSIYYLKNLFASQNFSDAPPNHKYYKEIMMARDMGIISGYEGTNNFGPDNYINRAEAAKIIVKVKNLNPYPGTTSSVFSDVGIGDWYYPFVMTLYYEKIVAGYPDGSFKPSNNLNKAEAAKLISGILGFEEE
ncbi:MAG: S-layer homology domain-containing protein [Candidatus Aminicenantes bacterium]|nr:S-layer homology domain-containing protein [Candidatus Aminicenantes bacterium]